jgi:RNA polymerase sigma-70 factor (ECF subfamily)
MSPFLQGDSGELWTIKGTRSFVAGDSPDYAGPVKAGGPDERSLVEAANRGEARAYEELYRRHGGWVVTLARRLTGNQDDALDVLQETFAHLWTRFPGFRLTSTLRAYLYPVVKHASVDVLRRRRRDVGLGVAALATRAAAGPTGTLGFMELLEKLPAGQREVLLLRFAYDFRLAEIADALDVPLGTVKSRLHNALADLRRVAGKIDPVE